MRKLALVIAFGALAACSPPAGAPAEQEAAATPEAPAADLGPYANSWDAAEFSRFRHTLHTSAAGPNVLSLTAQTDAPGGETVAVYPVGPGGERRTVRLVFVVADGDGETAASEPVVVPPEGLPVEVVVENAGGRRHAGSYTLSVSAPTP